MYTVTMTNVTTEKLEEIRRITKHDMFPGVSFGNEWDAVHLSQWVKEIAPDSQVNIEEHDKKHSIENEFIYKGHQVRVFLHYTTDSYSVEIFPECDTNIHPMTIYGTLGSELEAINVAYGFIDGLHFNDSPKDKGQ